MMASCGLVIVIEERVNIPPAVGNDRNRDEGRKLFTRESGRGHLGSEHRRNNRALRTRASPRALRGSNRAKDAGRRRVARNIESRRDPTALLAFWPSHGLFGKSPVATNGG